MMEELRVVIVLEDQCDEGNYVFARMLTHTPSQSLVNIIN